MGYPTKVQLIKRKSSQQWYVNFPAQLAQAMEFEKGETVEWGVKDRYTLTLLRKEARDKQTRKKKVLHGIPGNAARILRKKYSSSRKP